MRSQTLHPLDSIDESMSSYRYAIYNDNDFVRVASSLPGIATLDKKGRIIR